ncbi:hypothetical protein RND71_013937 [Anisodus tanguticus]|uniref:Uncharacterized protein n=1 Tax=Anisodus tanguticus TaxID=243964 RepID=A0AAE1SAF6_9SOLA|nr:hypothetical protein RND71_013937 [Anisodus tanguticus]
MTRKLRDRAARHQRFQAPSLDVLLLRNDFERLFRGLKEDKERIDTALRRIMRLLRVILQMNNVDVDAVITPRQPLKKLYRTNTNIKLESGSLE